MVEKFCEFIKKLGLDFNDLPQEFDYKNPVLILVDAVLSINRRYEKFVVPRIKLIENENIKTLEEFLRLIRELGEVKFCELWNYNHAERVRILRDLTGWFLQVKEKLKTDDDLVALHMWGEQSTINDFRNFNIPGIGFTTFQYLRLLCKSDTSKPDRHILRAVREGVGKRLSEFDAVYVVEEAAKKLGIPVRKLDYALWRYYSI